MRKAVVLVSIILTSSLLSYGQLSYKLGINYCGGTNHYFVKPDFKETFSYTPQADSEFGVNIGFVIKNKFVVESGIFYNRESFLREATWNLAGIIQPNDPAIPENWSNNKYYIRVPLNFGVSFEIMERLWITPSIGISSLFLTGADEDITYMDGSITSHNIPRSNISSYLLDTQFKTLIDFEIWRNFGIGIEPYFGKRLSKPDIFDMKTAPISLGINGKLIYRID